TGAAGFIGFHLSKCLLEMGYYVLGIDNLNDYYDVKLKEDRLNLLKKYSEFKNYILDLTDRAGLFRVFDSNKIDTIINLAAQPGVRYSIENPQAYIDSNIQGFLNILEAARYYKPQHLIYASSSSVYGANTKIPFSVSDNVDHPMSLYAATKKANELMAHTYSSLYNIPTTGLRFFTVYGPWGRPDMALFLFTKAILEGQAIDVFNNGDMSRDFTYIDDIVQAVAKLIDKIPQPDNAWNGMDPNPATSYAPYRLYNIGNNNPVSLMEFIRSIERATQKKAHLNFLPMQPGDVKQTYADVSDLEKIINYRPSTPLDKGIKEFVNWYKDYYGVS
ncbi:MAG TPA: NAD-dependent epimerase, partial [Flammeovirgaceae bacterium]|nr:NAD-dependent epimerase [Flammeovirgaceae bacterium]